MNMLHRLRARWARAMGHPVAVGDGFIDYGHQPDPAWQATLDAHHIPGTARLFLAWEPGDVWQPIHRWFLWQLQPFVVKGRDGLPIYAVDRATRGELRGPHPRTGARLVQMPTVVANKIEMRTRVIGPCTLIDRRTWEIHRQWEAATGELVRPRRLWVIQGETGGHPFTIGPDEEKLRRSQGLPADVPSAGDLPYAPFDRRVLTALERVDLWRYAQGLGDPLTNGARLAIARVQDTERAAHVAMWQGLADLSDQWADEGAHAARRDGLHRLRLSPVGSKPRAADVDAARDAYINDFSLENATP